MDSSEYKIVFEKLREAQESEGREPTLPSIKLDLEELQEIDELRRLALEITDPDPTSYTTT